MKHPANQFVGCLTFKTSMRFMRCAVRDFIRQRHCNYRCKKTQMNQGPPHQLL
ncbi:hypothetical protein NEILACOT_03609 [Neisseria lactamica ATCC 23970]|uniref:Uncharacterized protein n=1 Tax=Neisseria lactamica ATCC 23970 TaxID=546265 RepID=D0W7V9_NEILA|nr:hypothetical protein NEILACOT_03609 [Neisseria lactamica ATCC 23970]